MPRKLTKSRTIPAKPTSDTLRQLSVLGIVIAAPYFAYADAPLTIEWIRQFGTIHSDQALSVSIDSTDNIFVGGLQNGKGFYSKYDVAGQQEWIEPFVNTSIRFIVEDGFGNVLSAYSPNESIPVLAKHDPVGNLLWSRPIDFVSSLSEPPVVGPLGDLLFTGSINRSGEEEFATDAHLVKLDANGSIQWTRSSDQRGHDHSAGTAVDRLGNSFMAVKNGLDAKVFKYDTQGNLVWDRTIGAGGVYFSPESVATDSTGNVFVAGQMLDAHGDWTDAFIRKYDPNGEMLWTRQFGGEINDGIEGVSVDVHGNAYITGYTYSAQFGVHYGDIDGFVAKIDPMGHLLWSHQFGTPGHDHSLAIAIDGIGNIAIAGRTTGDLGGPNVGDWDAWIALLRERLPGDFTGDGAIDNADLTLLLNHWGNPASPAPSGWNGILPTAPAIDNSELNALLNGWGQGSVSAPPAHVPEPASVFLIALAASLFARRAMLAANGGRRCSGIRITSAGIGGSAISIPNRQARAVPSANTSGIPGGAADRKRHVAERQRGPI